MYINQTKQRTKCYKNDKWLQRERGCSSPLGLGFCFFNQYEVELQTRSSGSMTTKEGRDHGETGKVHLRAALSGGDALQSEDHGAAIGPHAAVSPDFR